MSIPFRADYATWLGWLTPPDVPLLFVTDGISLGDVVAESLLVGYERFGGWLEAGMSSWVDSGLPTQTVSLVDAAVTHDLIRQGAQIIDVREPDEFAAGHIPGAINVPLAKIHEQEAALPADRPLVTYCGHGERASTGASLLERAGLGPIFNLDEGIGAWRSAEYPIITED